MMRTAAVLAAGCLVPASMAGPATAVGAAVERVAGRPDAEAVAVLQQLATEMVAAGVPGYTAQISVGGRTRVVRAGVADRETGRRISPRDAFDVASNTKTFAATLVLQLVAEHRLALDDSVETLLPGTVPNGENITLRMLLNHTSGLPDYTQDEAWFNALLTEPDRSWTYPELLAAALRHEPEFAPGTDRSYCNTGYLLVGMILEHLTDHSVADLLAQRITRPLGLTHTYYAAGTTFSPARHARGYAIGTRDGELTYTDVTDLGLLTTGMDGGVVSTTDDLTRFFRALLGGRLLPAAQLAEMKQTVSREGDSERFYGLGLQRVETPCGTTWGHGGASLGYLSTTIFSEDGSRALVSVTNANVVDPEVDMAVLERTLVGPVSKLQEQEACTLFGRPVPTSGS